MKTNLCFDPSPRKSNESIGSKETQKFLKYFPKYLKYFSLSTKDPSVISKLKQNKTIQHISYSSPSSVRNRRPEDLKDQSLVQFIENIKFLPDLKSIRFLLSKEKPQNNQENPSIQAVRKMRSLKKLKSLEFNYFLKHHRNLIKKLNAPTSLLSSLETFKIYCHWSEIQDVEPLTAIKQSKNLLKYMTSFHLGQLCTPFHQKSFQSFANSCPNLFDLSFEFGSWNRFPVEKNYLSTVKTFHKLKSLNLRIKDAIIFFIHFALPPLARNLRLDFGETPYKGIMLRIDSTFTHQKAQKIFKENQTLVKFYNNFQHLQSLETLQINSFLGSEIYEYQSYLCQEIIKRIPSLKKLLFVPYKPYYRAFLVIDSYFSQILESCHHFSNTLQTLEFGAEEIVITKLDLFSSRKKFSNLSTMTFTGRFTDPNIEIYDFFEQIMNIGESIQIIRLNTLINGTFKSLLSLVRQLHKLQKPSKIKLELQVQFLHPKESQEIGISMKDAMEELQEDDTVLQGVFLKIFTSLQLKEFFAVYGNKFERFEIINPKSRKH